MTNHSCLATGHGLLHDRKGEFRDGEGVHHRSGAELPQPCVPLLQDSAGASAQQTHLHPRTTRYVLTSLSNELSRLRGVTVRALGDLELHRIYNGAVVYSGFNFGGGLWRVME